MMHLYLLILSLALIEASEEVEKYAGRLSDTEVQSPTGTTNNNNVQTDIENSIEFNKITILAFTDNTSSINNILQICKDVELCVVKRQTNDFRDLQRKYNVVTIPTVLLITTKDKYDPPTVKYFTGHKIERKRIETYIKALVIDVHHFTLNEFKEKVMTVYKGRRYIPYIVGFYAYWADRSRLFLSLFKSAVEDFQEETVDVRFGLVDIVEEKRIVERFINVRYAEKVPFLLLFTEGNGTVIQNHLAVERPSSNSVYQACNITLTTTDGHKFIYNPYGQSSEICNQDEDPRYGNACSTVYNNNTDYMVPVDKQYNITINTVKLKLPPNIYGMEKLSNKNMDNILKVSFSKRNLLNTLTVNDTVQVFMIVFIIEGCSSCNNHIKTFQSLEKQVNNISGSSFYIVNCTSDSSLCQQYNVTGYPTIILLRKLDRLSRVCFTAQQPYSDIRLDYHGPIQDKLLMNWYYDNTGTTVTHLQFTKPSEIKDENIRLIGTVVPRTSSYLPRSIKSYYSLQCYKHICDVLYGISKCYTVYSDDIPPTVYDKVKHHQLILTQLIIERKDGIKINIMKLGQLLYNTLQEETDLMRKLHKPHRYSIRQNQFCEEDHGMCSEYLISFIRDHSRLPLTYLSSTLFHTSNNLLKENNLPVVITMMTASQIHLNSTFFKMLTEIGYEYYDRLMMVILDVDMYPAWAGQFVPFGYSQHDDAVYTYPRMCIIHWTDHQHAAFYPPLDNPGPEELFSKVNIKQFLNLYLQNPSYFIVKTEHF